MKKNFFINFILLPILAVYKVYGSHEYVCLTIQRGFPATVALSGGVSGVSWTGCSIRCRDLGYDGLTLSSTSVCYCHTGMTTVTAVASYISCKLPGSQTALKGGWNLWGNWKNSDCVAGYLNKTRQRLCNFPPLANGGATCTGISSEKTTAPCLPRFRVIPRKSKTSFLPGSIFGYDLHLESIKWNIDKRFDIFAISSSTNRRTDIGIYGFSGIGSTSEENHNVHFVNNNSYYHVAAIDGVTIANMMVNNRIRINSTAVTTGNDFKAGFLFKMTDSVELNNGEHATASVVAFLGSDVEYIYVYAAVVQKINEVGNKAKIDFQAASQDLGLFSRPGIMEWFRINLVALSTQSATNVTVHVYLPITTTFDYLLQDAARPFASYIASVVDKDKSSITFKIPYVDPSVTVTLHVYWKVAENDFTMFVSHQENNYFVFTTLSYCPYDQCNDIQKLHYVTKLSQFGWKPINPQLYVTPFYIKERSTGNCWKYVTPERLNIDSTCDTQFKWSKGGILKLVDINRFFQFTLLNYNLVSYEYFLFMTHIDGQIRRPVDSVKGNCFYVKDGKVKESRRKPHPKDSSQCVSLYNSHVTVLIPVYSTTDNVPLRSLLKATTPLGETIFICNLAGDMGSKYNCFYTVNQGKSWIALSSMITNVKMYLHSTTSIYGYSNRGKNLFQMDLRDHSRVIYTITTDAYDVIRGQHSPVYPMNFDEPLQNDPVALSADPLIGVSTVGVYRLVDSAWRQIFYWR